MSLTIALYRFDKLVFFFCILENKQIVLVFIDSRSIVSRIENCGCREFELKENFLNFHLRRNTWLIVIGLLLDFYLITTLKTYLFPHDYVGSDKHIR